MVERKGKKLRIKKVIWVSDRNYPEYNGGAERTDYVIREAGKKLGIDIEWTNDIPKNEADFYVISNIHLWSDDKAREFLDQEPKTLFFVHDPLMHSWYTQAIRQSFCTVFMSPRHAKAYTKKFLVPNHFIQPHGIEPKDLERFKPLPKKDYYLYVGDMNDYKGIGNVYQWAIDNPKEEVRCWGRNFARFPFFADNFKYYGFLPEKWLAKILGEARYFIHLPNLVDPCPRMIMFAYLAGCTVIGNDNIGLSSYDWPWDDKEKIKEILKKAPKEFWYKVDKFYRKGR